MACCWLCARAALERGTSDRLRSFLPGNRARHHALRRAARLRGYRLLAGTLDPVKAKPNHRTHPRHHRRHTNGHPAPWEPLRELASEAGVMLIEDSTEAIGSVYKGKIVGGLATALFLIFQPGPLVCGEGGMIVTDDDELARSFAAAQPSLRGARIRRARRYPPFAGFHERHRCALGLAQLRRIELLLARRKRVERWYYICPIVEGIKDPYVAPEVDQVCWFLYVVHLAHA